MYSNKIPSCLILCNICIVYRMSASVSVHFDFDFHHYFDFNAWMKFKSFDCFMHRCNVWFTIFSVCIPKIAFFELLFSQSDLTPTLSYSFAKWFYGHLIYKSNQPVWCTVPALCWNIIDGNVLMHYVVLTHIEIDLYLWHVFAIECSSHTSRLNFSLHRNWYE